MNIVVIGICFVAAVLLTLSRGAGSAFALVYLPSLVLLSQVRAMPSPGLPDPTAAMASVYGILLGGLLAGRKPRLRPTPVDYIFVALLLTYFVSTVQNEGARLALNIVGSMSLKLVAPYFIVRCSLERRSAQREALIALVAAIVVIGLFALIEMRLWPDYYGALVSRLGLQDAPDGLPRYRFGLLNRANASFQHPIDLSIGAALIFAAIFILAIRSGVGLRRPWVRAGLAVALFSSISALSFTAYFGISAALALFLALLAVPSTRRFLAAGVVLLFALGFFWTSHVAHAPQQPPPIDESAFGRSYRIRQLIIKRGWEMAATAGPFGWGAKRAGEIEAQAELEYNVASMSTDNAYLVIAAKRGWVALSLWLALLFFLALLVTRALRGCHSRQLALAIVCGYCACLGTMVAMFTVYFGMTYPALFMLLVALTVNAAQAARPSVDHVRMRRRPGLSSRPRPA